MAFCTSCGAEVSGAAVCLECGASQGAAVAAPTPVTVSSDGLAENVSRRAIDRYFRRPHYLAVRTGYHFLGRRFAGSLNAGSDL
jgi:hypothetical protein